MKTKKKTVIVVDDQESSRNLIKAIVNAFEQDLIAEFESPFQMMMELQINVPDLIVVDYDYGTFKMPFAIMDDIHEMDCKVIVFSGENKDKILKDLIGRGMKSQNINYVQKGGNEIFKKIRQALGTMVETKTIKINLGE